MKQYLFSAVVAAAVAAFVTWQTPQRIVHGVAPESAQASQNQLSSPTTGTVSGLQLSNNYNNALDSVNTCNSGASGPVNQLSGAPSLGNCWLNTTSNPYVWGLYDGANWLTVGAIDATNHIWDGQVGGGTNTVASASSTDLCSVPQYFLTISGTTTINGFGSSCPAGVQKVVTFSGILTLTYNGTSLIIPGAANVLTAAGDQAIVMALGSGNWRVVNYIPANGQALINPAIEVGTYVMTSAVSVPSSKYLLADGQAISRTTYAALMSLETITQSVSATSGSPTLTGFSDTTQIPIGAPIEAAFIPNGTSISSCTSTTCMMSANATTSTSGSVAIFPYGNGCGAGSPCSSPSTSFNLPDCRDVVLAGRGNMGGTDRGLLPAPYFGNFGGIAASLGALGGASSVQITTNNVPTINSANASQSITVNPNGTTSAWAPINVGGTWNFGGPAPNSVTASENPSQSSASVGSTNSFSANNSISVTSTNTGGSSPTAIRTIQPTLTMNCMVRVLAMLAEPPTQDFAANDNVMPIAVAIERRRHLAA